MPAGEVTLLEREMAASAAGSALDAMAAEWLEARVSGDRNRVEAAGPALDEAVRDHRRASSALKKTRRRLARRGELTTNNEEDGRP